VEELDGPRAYALNPQHVQQAAGHLCAQALVILEASGLRQLGQLGAKCGPGARDVRRLTGAISGRDVLRPALDGIRHAAVGDGLVHHFAKDLEHVRDLVEDPCELAVAEHRLAGAGRAARSRHRSPL